MFLNNIIHHIFGNVHRYLYSLHAGFSQAYGWWHQEKAKYYVEFKPWIFEQLTPLWKEAIYAVQGGTNSNRCKYQLNSSIHDFIAHLLLKENMDAQSSYHSCKKLDATSPFHLQALIWMIIFSKYDPKGTLNTNIAICVCISLISPTRVYGYLC